MSDSTHLGLTFLEAAQAQKHVTVNEALARIDALAQLAVKSRGLSAPPSSPAEGARYLLGATPTGDWAGQGEKVAMFLQGQWQFASPVEGWRLWVDDEDKQLLFDGNNWTEATAPVSLQNMQMVGVNASADTTNRLAVSSAASLFNHAGAGHQIKLNKNAAGDTAALLFQTGFSGRAEIGTTGDDLLHMKVSSNGSTYEDILVADATAAELRLPKGMTLPPRAAPTIPADGQVWHDSATASLKVQLGGTTHQVAPATPAGLVAEYQRGMAALGRVWPHVLGRKAMVLDFVGGGFANLDEAAACELRSIVNIPGLTIANATGGKRITRKRRQEMVGINALRDQHGPDGTPQGVLIEAAHAYLNAQTQPTVAQLGGGASNIADTAAPAGETGNWLTPVALGTIAPAMRSASVTAGQDYYVCQEVVMPDGAAPLIGLGVGDDFDFLAASSSSTSLKHPDTGAVGFKIIGPLAGGKFLAQAYVTAAATGTYQFGPRKLATSNNRFPKWGALNFGPGRHPTSMFDNATATPNGRAADVVIVPVSGFSYDQITIAGEFVCPPATAQYRAVVTGSSDYRGLSLVFSASSLIPRLNIHNNAGVNVFDTFSAHSLVAGSKYRFAIAIDPVTKTVRAKFTGLSAESFVAAGIVPADISISHISPGRRSDGMSLQSTLSLLAVVDRAWTAAEIAAFAG